MKWKYIILLSIFFIGIFSKLALAVDVVPADHPVEVPAEHPVEEPAGEHPTSGSADERISPEERTVRELTGEEDTEVKWVYGLPFFYAKDNNLVRYYLVVRVIPSNTGLTNTTNEEKNITLTAFGGVIIVKNATPLLNANISGLIITNESVKDILKTLNTSNAEKLSNISSLREVLKDRKVVVSTNNGLTFIGVNGTKVSVLKWNNSATGNFTSLKVFYNGNKTLVTFEFEKHANISAEQLSASDNRVFLIILVVVAFIIAVALLG